MMAEQVFRLEARACFLANRLVATTRKVFVAREDRFNDLLCTLGIETEEINTRNSLKGNEVEVSAMLSCFSIYIIVRKHRPWAKRKFKEIHPKPTAKSGARS